MQYLFYSKSDVQKLAIEQSTHMLLFQIVRNRNRMRILSRQMFQKDNFLLDTLKDLANYQALLINLTTSTKEMLCCRSGPYFFPEEELFVYLPKC